MNDELVRKMKAIVLDMFSAMPGLNEGFCLPPRWYLHNEIIHLNQLEKDALETAFNELSYSGIIDISESGAMGQKISITALGLSHITKNKMKADTMNESSNQINITELHADNVQVGSENIMNINLTPDEFISLMEKVSRKPEKEKTSIFDKLKSAAKSGASIMSIIGKMKDIV